MENITKYMQEPYNVPEGDATGKTAGLSLSIRFLGATGRVSGSRFLLEVGDTRILVDAGLFQGSKAVKKLNRDPFPADLSTIDVILLTSASLNHCGGLPKLIREGYSGEVWAPEETLELAEIILKDRAQLNEEDAQRAGLMKFTEYHEPTPIYTQNDVKETIAHFNRKPRGRWLPITEHISCRFRKNGYSLGSFALEIRIGEKIVLFSGNVAREDDLFMHASERPAEADVLILESTFGNQFYVNNAEIQLTELINKAAKGGGTILVTGFAMEVAPLLAHLLAYQQRNDFIPDLPAYLDMPHSQQLMNLFHRHLDWFKMGERDAEQPKSIRLVGSLDETMALAAADGPKIVLSGSEMASGGRALSYLANVLPDPASAVILVGYQEQDTRARSLIEGAREVKIFGQQFPVRAAIEHVDGLFSHGDQRELLHWVSRLEHQPERIFLIHGEPDAARTLKEKLYEHYHWNAEMPHYDQVVDLWKGP